MKNHIFFLILLIVIASSCVPDKKIEEPSEQDKFIELVSQRLDSINSCSSTNPIQVEKNKNKKIFYNNQFYRILSNYSDSILIFKNWHGVVTDFEYVKKEKSSFILLNIEIKYKGDKIIFYPYDRISLESIYRIDNKFKDSDPVFNNMSKINKGTGVFIEGYISRSMNGNISVKEKFNNFNFTILNVSTSLMKDSISPNMNEAIIRKFKEMKIFGKGVLDGKNENQINKESDYLKNDSILNTLSESEKVYIKKIEFSYAENIAKEFIDKY